LLVSYPSLFRNCIHAPVSDRSFCALHIPEKRIYTKPSWPTVSVSNVTVSRNTHTCTSRYQTMPHRFLRTLPSITHETWPYREIYPKHHWRNIQLWGSKASNTRPKFLQNIRFRFQIL
jgi:hypothetical protein